MASNCRISKSVENFNIPVSHIQHLHPSKRLVVGVAIFVRGAKFPPKLLLLQRSDLEDSFPSMFEIPGGGAEPQDSTLLDTVIRETEEETGLVVSGIIDTFPGFEYSTRSGDAIQFNFVVEVELQLEGSIPSVVLNPEEHQAFSWLDVGAGEDELARFKLTDSMLVVVSNALKVGQKIFEAP